MSSGTRSRSIMRNNANYTIISQLSDDQSQDVLLSNCRLDKKSIDTLLEKEERRIGEIEYTKVVVKALKEAIAENDKLRGLINQINNDNEGLKSVLDERDNIIEELAEYYQFCQVNHVIPQGPIKRKCSNTRGTLSGKKKARTQKKDKRTK